MLRKLLPLMGLMGLMSNAQAISVNTSTYTPTQLVQSILPADCITPTNIVTSSACGIGYFESNGSNFPFANGLVLRSGNAALSAGPYADNKVSSVCSNVGDTDLAALNGGPSTVVDATFVKFNFQPNAPVFSFNFIFASNEYGPFQCAYSDSCAFILSDLVTGAVVNLAVVPGTNIRVNSLNIRDNTYAPSCSSNNLPYFGSYNVGNASSATSFAGQTVPMTAYAVVDPTHVYQLKLVVGDSNDSQNDSAVFVEGSSLFGTACQNLIQMQAFLDANGDGIRNNGEPGFSNGSFSYTENNSGDPVQSFGWNGVSYIPNTIASSTYDLNFNVDPQYAPYFSATASFDDVSYIPSGNNTYYFPVTVVAPGSDSSVAIVPGIPPRPGFDFEQHIYYTNHGYTPVSGTVIFQADPATPIVSVSPASAVTPEGFSFAFTDLQPGETRLLNVLLHGDLSLNLGDLVHTSVGISTADDILPANNTATLSQVVVNSFDPNDKTENHGPIVDVTQFGTDEYLYYTINFENVGTADAVNVRVEDVLDAQLDENTVRMVAASDPYVLERRGSNLVWKLDRIYLTSPLQDAAGSHGFVAFKVKPKPGFAAGDIIPNQANIFFDFNDPIQTNTVHTEFALPLGIPNPAQFFAVYPNPAKSILHVASQGTAAPITQLELCDLSGRKVAQIAPNSAIAEWKLPNLTAGVYLLKISSGTQHRIQKLIID